MTESSDIICTRNWSARWVSLTLSVLICAAGTTAIAQTDDVSQGDSVAQPLETESSSDTVGSPSENPVDVAERLAYAENSWLFGDYAEVIRVLDPLLFPEPNVAFTREQLIDAYELLGASFFLQTGSVTAEQSFHELLRLEPDYRLDPFLYPASAVNYLDLLRNELAPELDEIRAQRRETQEPQGIRFVERRVEERSLVVSILPFGIGQFVNDQDAWGYFYLSTEVVLGTVSLAMYLTNEASRDEDGYVPDSDVAQRRQSIQLGTAISFFAVLVAGMIHGAVIHEDVVQTSYGIIEEPPEDFLEPQSSIPRFDGWVSGDGFQLGISGIF